MGGGSLLIKKEWVRKECPILTLARETSRRLFINYEYGATF